MKDGKKKVDLNNDSDDLLTLFFSFPLSSFLPPFKTTQAYVVLEWRMA